MCLSIPSHTIYSTMLIKGHAMDLFPISHVLIDISVFLPWCLIYSLRFMVTSLLWFSATYVHKLSMMSWLLLYMMWDQETKWLAALSQVRFYWKICVYRHRSHVSSRLLKELALSSASLEYCPCISPLPINAVYVCSSLISQSLHCALFMYSTNLSWFTSL